MSVQFTRSSSEAMHWSVGTQFDNLTALSLFIWAMIDSTPGNMNFITKWRFSGPTDKGFILFYSSGSNRFGAEWAYNDTESTDLVLDSAGPSTGQWYALGSSWQTTTRNLWVDGTAKTANTNSRTTISDNGGNLYVASQQDLSNYLDGKVCVPTAWNVALTDAEHQQLASGVYPTNIRPDALIFHAPLMSTDAAQCQDWIQHLSATQLNTPTNGSNGPLLLPRKKIVTFPQEVVVAGGGSNVPAMMHSYRRRRAS